MNQNWGLRKRSLVRDWRSLSNCAESKVELKINRVVICLKVPCQLLIAIGVNPQDQHERAPGKEERGRERDAIFQPTLPLRVGDDPFAGDIILCVVASKLWACRLLLLVIHCPPPVRHEVGALLPVDEDEERPKHNNNRKVWTQWVIDFPAPNLEKEDNQPSNRQENKMRRGVLQPREVKGDLLSEISLY